MAKGVLPGKNIKIAAFTKRELDELVETLSNEHPALKVNDGALMGALILAARRVPLEAVAAVLSTYWDRQKEVAAIEVVGAFLRAMGEPG